MDSGIADIGLVCLIPVGVVSSCQSPGAVRAWTAWLPIGDQILLVRLSNQYRYRLTGEMKYRKIPVIITELLFILLNWWSVIWAVIFLAIITLTGLGAVGVGMTNLGLMMFGGLDAADHLLKAENTVATSGGGFLLWMSMISIVALLFITVIRTVINSRLMMDVYRSCHRKAPGMLLTLGILFPFLKLVFLFLCAITIKKNDTAQRVLDNDRNGII